MPVTAAEQNAATLVNGPLDAPKEFEACASSKVKTPKAISLGNNLGPGISEKIDKPTLKALNNSLKSAGQKQLPGNVYAMRYFDSVRIVALDKKGEVVKQISSANSSELNTDGQFMAARGILNPQVKRIIGACLGFGGAGGMSFEALVRYLSDPKKL